ncbi:MAG TPA: NIPSNAP family protein [Alphaproteobacteria bacterium]|nr:NIPSNAP family protein [Alphaproteobacteria bacterium]
MILEQRTYTLHPGKVHEFLGVVEEYGLPVLKPTLGNLIGYFYTDVGTVNQVVHLWAYESQADREIRRAKLEAMPEFLDFAGRARPLMQTMEARILIAAKFNTVPLMNVDPAAK